MNNIALNLEGSIKAFAENLSWMQREVADIYKAYFATDATTLVGALATGASGASLASKLTKSQYQAGITFVEQMTRFFGNQSITTADYLGTIEAILYGNAASPARLSDAAEDIADRMKVACGLCLGYFNSAKDILDTYSNSELSVLVSGLAGSRIIYGANMNATQLGQGITLIEQYKKLINNEAVSTGSYGTNVAIWRSI